ncbi:hypothetical protein ACLQ9F_15400 [Bordetella avium]|uniref:hypothetical protein n=2 Tax=Bordetella avium TaxID=521 RepID=UPI000E698AB4|nr:hypothetical protein [Bordetella avium]RIQ40371.1 hypothetical protein D0846_16175 [Bordetella avium]RIQ46340.1 hypothetical protein D0845_16065 [Bordetella avium]RIQ59497.1 hypothetical protein D0842_14470 [Bordetella avium]RIQ69193.1 hypothetical protein D0836_16040 [Bordetella avium]RIQ77586.1 hypothetical protein D0835_14960 [Bordetella avium]
MTPNTKQTVLTDDEINKTLEIFYVGPIKHERMVCRVIEAQVINKLLSLGVIAKTGIPVSDKNQDVTAEMRSAAPSGIVADEHC